MAGSVYRFGPFLLDSAARELRRDGARVAVSQKVFDCLTWLIEHRDRAVGRDELIAAVWRRIDVSDTHLGKTLFQARRAVGDNGDGQELILTIPRFGYRWVAQTQVDSASAAVAPASGLESPADILESDRSATVEPSAEKTPAPPVAAAAAWSRATVFGTVAILLGLAVFALLASRGRFDPSTPPVAAGGDARPATATALPADALAVLPATVRADEGWAWLRLGLMDLLANRLRKTGLSVVPSDNVVAAVRMAADDASVAAAVDDITAARRLLVPTVSRSDAGWIVQLELRADGAPPRRVEARAADAVSAAQAAADRLLAMLGKPVPAGTSGQTASIEELAPRVESALLADDPAAARQWLAAAPPALLQRPQARLYLARIDLREGHVEAARERLDALLKETPAETDPLLRARVLLERAHAALFAPGTAGSPIDTLDEALTLLSERDEPALLAAAHSWRGIAQAQVGRYDLARADFARARVALRLAGDTLGLARIDANEGIMDVATGRYADALPALVPAAEQLERFGEVGGVVQALNAQVRAELAMLHADRALVAADRLHDLLPRLGSPLLRSLALAARSAALTANGRLDEAKARSDEALREAERSGELGLRAELLGAQARTELASGRAETAVSAARQAVDALSKPDGARARADAWLVLVRALRSLGRDSDAAGEVARFAAWAATAGDPAAKMCAVLAEAEQAWTERRREDAERRYEDALQSAHQLGAPRDIVDVADSYGRTLLTEGELTRAAAVIGQVARWAEQDFICALLQAQLYQALDQREAWQSALDAARARAGERPIPAAVPSTSAVRPRVATPP